LDQVIGLQNANNYIISKVNKYLHNGTTHNTMNQAADWNRSVYWHNMYH